MWDEAEMREIEPEPEPALPGAGARQRAREDGAQARALRREISERNVLRASAGVPHQLSRGSSPAVVYRATPGAHGNFIEGSYRRICARPAWYRRLHKAHGSKRQGAAQDLRSDQPGRPWCELDSSNSSDALLMNVFCYPRVLAGDRLPALLGIDRGLEPVFGFRPRVPLQRGMVDQTEVDMRLGPLLVESKLTEGVPAAAPLRKVERYRDFDAVFERGRLLRGAEVRAYQLVRGVLAASALDAAFCLLCDARRPEMMEAWQEVALAVHSLELRSRLKLLTWQELASVLPETLQRFMADKYGIGKP